MTYREVSARSLRWFQLATFLITGVLGIAVLFTPMDADAKLTAIERVLDPNVWGWVMALFGALGFTVEYWKGKPGLDPGPQAKWLSLVSWCHIILVGVVASLGLSALVSVLIRQPYNFGAPALAVYLSFAHALFIKRRFRG